MAPSSLTSRFEARMFVAKYSTNTNWNPPVWCSPHFIKGSQRYQNIQYIAVFTLILFLAFDFSHDFCETIAPMGGGRLNEQQRHI